MCIIVAIVVGIAQVQQEKDQQQRGHFTFCREFWITNKIVKKNLNHNNIYKNFICNNCHLEYIRFNRYQRHFCFEFYVVFYLS